MTGPAGEDPQVGRDASEMTWPRPDRADRASRYSPAALENSKGGFLFWFAILAKSLACLHFAAIFERLPH